MHNLMLQKSSTMQQPGGAEAPRQAASVEEEDACKEVAPGAWPAVPGCLHLLLHEGPRLESPPRRICHGIVPKTRFLQRVGGGERGDANQGGGECGDAR